MNYLLAMRHYDIAAHQPHPPGNPLYILLGRLAHLVIPDANQALIAVSILATVAVVILTALVARRLAGARFGFIAAALVAANPLMWLYGEVGLSYVPEAAAGLCVAVAAWTSHERPSWRSMACLGAALALAGGLRPTVLVLLIPLWLFGLWTANWRGRAVASAVAAVGCLVWLVPLVVVSGGPLAYLTQLRLLSASIDDKTTIFTAPWRDWLTNVEVVVVALAIGLNAVAALGVGSLLAHRGRLGRFGMRSTFLLVWMLPPLAVFSFVHFGQPGYLLLILPPSLMLCLFAVIQTWPRVIRTWTGTPVLVVLLGVSLVISSAMVPTVSAHDRSWTAVQSKLTALPPADTVLIAATDPAGDFRLAGYLVPSIHTLGVGDDLSGSYGILYEALGGHSTYRLDPALHACQVVRLNGVRNLVVTGQSLVEHVVNNGQWTRTRVADGTDMLVRRQANPGMTVMFDGRSATVVSGLASGAGLTCAASARSPLTVMSTAGK